MYMYIYAIYKYIYIYMARSAREKLLCKLSSLKNINMSIYSTPTTGTDTEWQNDNILPRAQVALGADISVQGARWVALFSAGFRVNLKTSKVDNAQ